MFSIITPTFNAEKTINDCIKSVANQTCQNKEHWIIDNLSTDNTLTIVKEWAEKYPHIKYISEKDSGIYEAMNKGIELSTGAWLYFMGSDDTLYKDNTLEHIKNYLNNNCQLVLGKIELKNTNPIIYRKPSTNWKRFLYNVPHQGCIYHRSIFEKYQYDQTLKIGADYKLYLQLFKDNIKYLEIDTVICRFNTEGVSGKDANKSIKEYNKVRVDVLYFPIALLFNTVTTIIFKTTQILKKTLSAQAVSYIHRLKHTYWME